MNDSKIDKKIRKNQKKITRATQKIEKLLGKKVAGRKEKTVTTKPSAPKPGAKVSAKKRSAPAKPEPKTDPKANRGPSKPRTLAATRSNTRKLIDN